MAQASSNRIHSGVLGHFFLTKRTLVVVQNIAILLIGDLPLVVQGTPFVRTGLAQSEVPAGLDHDVSFLVTAQWAQHST